MRGLKIATVALCAAVWIGMPVGAQSLRAVSGPSELPPAGFKSDQYVDSRGCVFIRAGFGGTTAWVPRVGNNRKPVCGQKASVAAVADAVPAPAPAVVAPAAVAVAAPALTPAPAPIMAKPPAKPALVAPVIAAPRPAAVVPRESYVPARVAVAAPQPPSPTGRARVQIVTNAAQCPGPVAGTAERQLSDGRRVVACGTARGGLPVYLLVAAKPASPAARSATPTPTPTPVVQAAAPAQPARVTAPAPAPAPAAAQCGELERINQLYLVDDGRLVVKCGKGSTYLVVGRADLTGTGTVTVTGSGNRPAAAAPAAASVPKGYKLAWDDGRLSTTRGPQTAAGEAAMRLVWSDDTPRRLIDHASGRDVTMDFAFLQYPFTSAVEQEQGVARLSAMNEPTAQTRRFVQIGSFAVAANATAAAARLKGAGLPVQVAAVTSNGTAWQVVLAGPFDQADQVAAALATARATGFADAFARN